MQKLSLFLLFLLTISCEQNQLSTSSNKEKKSNSQASKTLEEIKTASLQKIIDSTALKGSILIVDFNKNKAWSNDFQRCKTGFLPASTFKIINSIIGLETGIVENDSTLFKWDGKPRQMKIWEQDLIFKDAFHKSCVPCYQEVAKKIGSSRMQKFLDKFDYGKFTITNDNIDLFWLEGEGRITPLQQVNFLRKFYMQELPLSERTSKIMKRMMVIHETKNYKISGKTGWSIRDNFNIGWFVGYIEKDNNIYFFATNVEPTDAFDMNLFAKVRALVTIDAFKALELL